MLKEPCNLLSVGAENADVFLLQHESLDFLTGWPTVASTTAVAVRSGSVKQPQPFLASLELNVSGLGVLRIQSNSGTVTLLT